MIHVDSMVRRGRAGVALALAIVLLGAGAGARADEPAAAGPAPPSGYADSFTVLSADARNLDAGPRSDYTFCVRNTATYECLSYAGDGTVKRRHQQALLHGTAFAYRTDGEGTLLLTNQHVAEWPAVTDLDHRVDGIPSGCKKIAESIRIVDDEHDIYERDDVPLTKVASDVAFDVAVLKAHAKLPVLPWKIGRSASLRARDVVEVHGFPLGAFKATNVGKVVSALDHDTYGEWDHDDFVIDALLSSGNSGSPVLAASRATGELELVGIFHANYSEGSALNVVIGIDQLRDFMTTLKRPVRASDNIPPVSPDDRRAMHDELRAVREPFFTFGPLAAAVREGQDGALVFEIFSADFPGESYAILAIEDVAEEGSFGRPARVFFGRRRGLHGYGWDELTAEDQKLVLRVLESLREDALAFFRYRRAVRDTSESREHSLSLERMRRRRSRRALAERELATAVVDAAERLSPAPGTPTAHLGDAFAPMAKPEGPTAQP